MEIAREITEKYEEVMILKDEAATPAYPLNILFGSQPGRKPSFRIK